MSLAFNLPPLPAPGDHFRDVTITDYAVRERDPWIMNALLRAVYTEYRHRRYHFMAWGSSAGDPLLAAAKGFMCQRVFSNIVFFATDDRWFLYRCSMYLRMNGLKQDIHALRHHGNCK